MTQLGPGQRPPELSEPATVDRTSREEAALGLWLYLNGAEDYANNLGITVECGTEAAMAASTRGLGRVFSRLLAWFSAGRKAARDASDWKDSGPGTPRRDERMEIQAPSSLARLSDSRAKKYVGDVHAFKENIVGGKVAHYDIFGDRSSGFLFLIPKKGGDPIRPIATGIGVQ